VIRIGYFSEKKISHEETYQVEPKGEGAAPPPARQLRSMPPRQSVPYETPVTFRGIVCAWQVDHMGHMNVQHYATMFDQASWVTCALLGLDSAYFRENRRAMAALEQTVMYKKELYAGDAVEIRSSILEVNNKTIRMMHEMLTLGGSVAARTMIVALHMDAEARKGTALPATTHSRAMALMQQTA